MPPVSSRVSAMVDAMEAKLRRTVGASGASGFDPITRSAVTAFFEAELNPGSLVRVTCRVEDVGDFVGQLIGCDPGLEKIDYESNRHGAKPPGGPVILEFRNGSGIEIALEKSQRPTGPQ